MIQIDDIKDYPEPIRKQIKDKLLMEDLKKVTKKETKNKENISKDKSEEKKSTEKVKNKKTWVCPACNEENTGSICECGERRPTKYKSKKTVVNGITFDSNKEANRYKELYELEKLGEITNLRLQVDFTLQEAFTTSNGERIRAIRYKADFTYFDKDNNLIVEDVKSRATKTPLYSIKRKLMTGMYNVTVKEI